MATFQYAAKQPPRYLAADVLNDLAKKMVFIGGPRQCGKTTLVRTLLSDHFAERGTYLNWDADDDRRIILKKRWPRDAALVAFDELHKFPKWKRWIKGLYDTRPPEQNFVVTGSARLDVYRRGGDSLLGRYHYWRLHPFTLSECPANMTMEEALRRLLTIGGFPEPFLEGDETFARRWRRERMDRVLRDDVRDLESVRNIQSLGLFVEALRSRVSSTVVLGNIATDLSISPTTLKAWLEVLERMYLVFTVPPLTRDLPRAVRKPPKVYFFDTGDVVGDEGARFENVVATALLKRLHYLEDKFGYRYELRYLRDKEGREVDFVILRENSVHELIECKYGDTTPSSHLRYYAEKLKPRHVYQVVARPTQRLSAGPISIVDAREFLAVPESSLSPE